MKDKIRRRKQKLLIWRRGWCWGRWIRFDGSRSGGWQQSSILVELLPFYRFLSPYYSSHRDHALCSAAFGLSDADIMGVSSVLDTQFSILDGGCLDIRIPTNDTLINTPPRIWMFEVALNLAIDDRDEALVGDYQSQHQRSVTPLTHSLHAA